MDAARQALNAPPYPEDVAYIHAWATDLYGRCGVSMGGVLPLNHQEIRAWRKNTGHAPNAVEIEALLVLDAVMRNPEPPKES